MSFSLPPRHDLDFLLFDWLRADDLVDRALATAMLDLSERVAADHFLPTYKSSDSHEPCLGDNGSVTINPAIAAALRQYADLGLFASGFPEGLGGLGLPFLLCSASFTYFAAANISASAYPMLTTANARLIATFGSERQVDHFARPQIEGRWFGTMCLSEPQAGSSLADIRTRAMPDGEDEFGFRFRIAGNKMWISGGDQDVSDNIVHLVLAKIPLADGALPAGTEGISLFIVPKILPDGGRNDIAVAGLNHKMGYRGTANCLLNFGEGRGAVGWLVGEKGDGLRQMFHMMNEARINVGLGAAALSYRGYRLSSRYAREREQGRPTSSREGPQVAIIEHADVKRMLLAQKAYCEGALALCLYCAKLVDTKDQNSRLLLGLLTPVAKTWPSEYGLAANDLAIQVHGGYGYTRDYDVEQLWRDNRLNPIHEGTTFVQAADLLNRKILRDESAYELFGHMVEATSARARAEKSLAGFAEALLVAWNKVARAVGWLRDRPGSRVTDEAVPFLHAFGHVTLAWIWLEQALAASSANPSGLEMSDVCEGKQLACRYFFECELTKIDAWLTTVTRTDSVAANAPARLL